MAILVNNAFSPVDIGTSDTTILNPSEGRAALTAASIHNTTASSIDVEIYDSPDATSASGKRIGLFTIDGNTDAQPAALYTAIEEDRFLIAVALSGSGGDLNIKIATTQYTGSD